MEKQSFFDRPAKAVSLLLAVIALLWSIQCTLFQTVLGKDIVETVMWGSYWQLGHQKHPPLSGWIGYLVAVCTGYSDFAMYLAAQVCLLIGVFYVYKLARLFLEEPESAVSALLLYLLFYYNPSSMKYCSHFVEAAFMPAMAYYIVRGSHENRLTDWLLAGVFTALGMLGKYSAGIILPGCLIYILWDRERRKCFLKPGIWLGILLGIILLLPHIFWLAANDFCCLRHVEKRISDDIMPWYYALEVGGVGIAPVLIELAALFLARLPNRKESLRKPVDRKTIFLPLLLTLIPVVVLMVSCVLGGDVVLMWYSFLAGWTGIAAVGLFPWQITRNVFRNLWILTVAYTVIALTASTVDIVKKTRLRCHLEPKRAVEAVEKFYHKKCPGKKLPPVIGERWICGVVQFYSPDHPLSFNDDDPVSLKPFLEQIRRNGCLLLVENPESIKKTLPELAGKLKFECFEVEYRAPFGRLKNDEYYVACYPGGGN